MFLTDGDKFPTFQGGAKASWNLGNFYVIGKIYPFKRLQIFDNFW